MRKKLQSLTALALIFSPALTAADDKKPEVFNPIEAKFETVHYLPFFCVAETLNREHILAPLKGQNHVPGEVCKPDANTKYIAVPAGNADDVATQLQPQLTGATSANATATAAAVTTGTASATATGVSVPSLTQFALSATSDKRAEIIFCRYRSCSGRERLEESIDKLAQPNFAYFKDYPIDTQITGKALLKVVPAINGKLSAEIVTPTTLRVESSKPLTDAELSEFEERLQQDQADIVATPTPPDKVAAQTANRILTDRQGATPDSQVVSVDLPDFCQADDLQTPPSAPGLDGSCPPTSRKVRANNIDVIVQAITNALAKSSSKLIVSKDGGQILIACDAKCADNVKLLQDTIKVIARPVPLLVHDIQVPRGTAAIAAATLSVAPLTASVLTDTEVRIGSEVPVTDTDLAAAMQRVTQRGFGDSESSILHQMFYHSAADIVGDLLSTPPPGSPAALGANAATPPVTGNTSAPATSSSSTAGTTVNVTTAPAASATNSSTPAPGPAPTGTLGQGMAAVNDSVVFTDTSSRSAVAQRGRLLTLLDLPRPEVLMNMWSFQASSPDGKEMAATLQKARDLVSANNDALQHAIDYGWAYLSRQMKDPTFFNSDFHDYLTKRFVADTEACEAQDAAASDCLTPSQRLQWDVCDQGRYCLGYEETFRPIRPTLTNILLGMMAAADTGKAVLTTIGCMEGKFEVYGADCFPERASLAHQFDIAASQIPGDDLQCLKEKRAEFLNSDEANAGSISDSIYVVPDTDEQKQTVLGCEILDRAAVYAQRSCGLPVTLPLSCFTIQAAKSFLPDNSFSTFSMQQLNSLAEVNLTTVERAMPPNESAKYSAPRVGLLRSAVADFLFNYKLASQYPDEFGQYSLPHSAQELNAEFNPLVVAFNQDVASLSRTLLDEVQNYSPGQHHNKSYVANGMLTVRGISGVESLVDTDTQNSFDATQVQTLNAVLSSILGTGSTAAAATPAASTSNTINVNPDSTASSSTPSGISCSNGSFAGSPLCAVANLFKGGTTAGGIATALAAISPVKSHSIIGRQLTLDVIPHTLPGASSAELDVRLWAQEDSTPTRYPESGASSQDYISRVARHNVSTRVRVESVKLFDVSTFTALVQRPGTKFPLILPFVEIPLIGSLINIPLPAAKVYHSSSAIVSAIIVPTASDLAYGLQFRADRGVFHEDPTFSHLKFSLRTLTSLRQLPETAPIYAFHHAMVQCLSADEHCGKLQFSQMPPER